MNPFLLSYVSRLIFILNWRAQALRCLYEGNEREEAQALLCMDPNAQFLPADQSENAVHEQWLSAPYVRCHAVVTDKLLPAAVASMVWSHGCCCFFARAFASR